jgi:hypothetical protein
MKPNPDYVVAMESFNSFFEMLYSVLKKSAISEISTSSAFIWRGYQIDRYKNLAASQYYFEIYYEDSHILRFQESYKDSKYEYPFRLERDLKETGFFYLNQQEQTAFLENFVKDALEKAVVWQDSKDRKSIVPAKFIFGKKRTNLKESVKKFGQVSEEYLRVSPMQKEIFSMLGKSLDRMTKLVLSRTNTREPNSQWRNWTFRGYRMKINRPDGTKPPGPFDYTWRIYFYEPTLICFETNGGKKSRRLSYLPMDDEFLNSSENEQQMSIDGFVKKSLESQFAILTP